MDRQESAQLVAIRALGWIAADDNRIAAMLAQTGISATDLRRRAGEPEVLAAVLDFLLGDEAAVLRFCAEEGLPPLAPLQARMALPGGELPDWT